MVTALSRILAVAETLARGAKVVQALREGGNGEAAEVINKECNRLARRIVSQSRRRNKASTQAKGRRRGVGGRFL